MGGGIRTRNENVNGRQKLSSNEFMHGLISGVQHLQICPNLSLLSSAIHLILVATLLLPILETLDALHLISLRKVTHRTLFAVSRLCSLVLAYAPQIESEDKAHLPQLRLILDLEYSKASVQR